MRTKTLIGFGILLLVSACSSLSISDNQKITLRSEPSGASVFIDGKYEGVTPLVLHFGQERNHRVRLSLKGYRDAAADITRSQSPMAMLKLRGTLCWIVDIASESPWFFERDSSQAILTKISEPIRKYGNHEILLAANGLTLLPYKGKTAILSDAKSD